MKSPIHILLMNEMQRNEDAIVTAACIQKSPLLVSNENEGIETCRHTCAGRYLPKLNMLEITKPTLANYQACL